VWGGKGVGGGGTSSARKFKVQGSKFKVRRQETGSRKQRRRMYRSVLSAGGGGVGD
jgi:hypothetical protein